MKTENKESQVVVQQKQKYDPLVAYFNRMTPAARANFNRRANHQFADSIGGDKSNYKF